MPQAAGRRASLLAALLACLIVPSLVSVRAAAQTAAQLTTQTAAPALHPIEGPSLLPMVTALVIVLGLIGLALWIMRRFGIAPRGSGGPLRLVSQLALGPRERIVVVEAGDRWLLLGVGAAGISRLGTMPKAEVGAVPQAVAPSFGALLARLGPGARS